MFLLILESLGSTELVFILVMALVFFGPRKLPQLSRTMGKHLAEFRRASEDFKRTWDREVSLEEFSSQNSTTPSGNQFDSSIWDEDQSGNPNPPSIEAVPADQVIPRMANEGNDSAALSPGDSISATEAGAPHDRPEPSRKRDWL